MRSYRVYRNRIRALFRKRRLEVEPSSTTALKYSLNPKRTALYALGAAEGLVLDRANPDWRRHYFEEKFSLDKHFPSTARP